MRKIKVVFGLLCLAAVLPAHATNGMRMIGFGPVQNSMGGVGVGASLDAATMASNPAGLTELGPAQQLDLAAGFFKPTVAYNATQATPAGVFAGQTMDSQRGGSPIPAVGYILPIDPNLTFGIGAYAAAGMGVDYLPDLYRSSTYTSYLQARLTPSIAYKLNDMVSVGVTVNTMLAQMKYNVAALPVAQGGMGQELHDTATSLGIGGVVGVKVTPIPMLSFGAAYETKSFFQSFNFNIPAHEAMVPGVGPMSFPGGQDQLTFNQPQVATIGASVKPLGEFLLLAADVEWINWADTNGANLPKFTSNTQLTGSMPFNLDWSNQWVFKVGAQVAATRDLKVRAGYNYGKTPLDPNRAFENIAFPAVAQHHFTAGLGYDVTNRFALNVAAMYSPKVTLATSNPMQQGIALADTSMSQVQVDLGLAYRF